MAVRFRAFDTACELLLPTMVHERALELGAIVAQEAWRIEHKLALDREEGAAGWIHRSRGTEVKVDPETAALIDFAKQCFELSDGLFDITAGVLRQVWTFDGSDRVPPQAAVAAVLPLVGFAKVQWRAPRLTLPVGMQLDLAAFGTAYAADRSSELLAGRRAGPFLVNFGGDVRARGKPPRGRWQVAVEGAQGAAAQVLQLEHGALTTRGEPRRYLEKDGVRYPAVLDPRTGWPVAHAPRAVTVAARSCMEAGLVATLALLNGARARPFLEEQSLRYWLLE